MRRIYSTLFSSHKMNYNLYNFYYLPGGVEKVSGVALTGGTVDKDGYLNTYGAYTQLVTYSEDTSNWTGTGPWTESITITETGTHTLSTNLDGATVTVTAGTATIDAGASATFGNPDQFEVSVIGTVTIETDVANPKAQISAGAYAMPYAVNTTSSALLIAATYADATSGPKFSLNTIPKLVEGLDGIGEADAEGELVVEWMPMFPGTVTINKSIICVNAAILGFLYNGWNIQLGITDTTTIETMGLTTWQAGTLYTIKAIWGTNHPTYPGVSKMQIIVTDGTTTWVSSVVDFDGSFDPTDYLSFGWENDYWQKFKSVKLLKEAISWV